ncbi:hypothetical protein BJV82DRAFT_320514 [Fennellomyces sp. T-0311]|nr:hypothetical protein BJV82DRAFT_320514 [Fennellomyces sp. T-0311]
MSNYVAKLALGKAAEHYQAKPSIVETDPEIRAAMEAASASTKKHWWKKRPQADIILSSHDRQVLRKVKSRAWYLDRGCKCCCFTVGLDGLIGLIPVVGDIIGVFLALNLVRVACQANLPNNLIFKMLSNVFVDFVLGLTPVAGDVLDVLFKCNWRNAMLLEEYLFIRRRDELRAEQGIGGYGSTGSTSSAPAVIKSTTPTTSSTNNGSPTHSKKTDKQSNGKLGGGSTREVSANFAHQALQGYKSKSGPREYATFIAIPQEA